MKQSVKARCKHQVGVHNGFEIFGNSGQTIYSKHQPKCNIFQFLTHCELLPIFCKKNILSWTITASVTNNTQYINIQKHSTHTQYQHFSHIWALRNFNTYTKYQMKSEIPEQTQTDQKLSENVHITKNYCKVNFILR